jgi:putative ABC transport system permease protein
MKHAFLSIVRKPLKAIIVFIILFIVNGLIFTGIIIQNSVRSSKEYVRKELGAIVELKVNYPKAMKDGLSFEDFESKLKLSPILAKEVAKDNRVKDLYITGYASAKNENLKSAIGTGNSSEGMGVISAAVGTLGGEQGSFNLIGSSIDVPLEFTDGTIQLTQGRYRDQTDEGKDTLYISEEFAAKNNLAVGDFIDLTSTVDSQAYPFEIIGIFSGSPEYLVDEMKTSLDSIEKLSAVGEGEADIASVKFMLQDPLEVENFIKQHENLLPNEYIELYSNDNEYKTLTRPLELVDTIITLLLIIVFIAGAIIMMAIITMFIKERRFEIGLLLSNGEGKLKILSQFIVEILLVSFLAFGGAAGVSKFTSDFTASWIINNQLVEEEVQSSNEIFVIGDPFGKDQLEIGDVANEFNVAVNAIVVRNLLLISIGIVIVSAGAPLIIILGYKPRESLQS